MKTTNYENSKKLAEIGFRKEGDFYGWISGEDIDDGFYTKLLEPKYFYRYPAYDLETILEALPDDICANYPAALEISKKRIGYYSQEGDCENGFAIFMEEMRKENDSLADTAARILILLHEKGLINFNN